MEVGLILLTRVGNRLKQESGSYNLSLPAHGKGLNANFNPHGEYNVRC